MHYHISKYICGAKQKNQHKLSVNNQKVGSNLVILKTFESEMIANSETLDYINQLWSDVNSYYTNKQLESLLISQSSKN